MDKQANVIIIGGTIAAGKSTLVDGIADQTGFYPYPELREGDEVQEIILKKLYENERIHKATVQYYFITNRYRQFKDSSSKLMTSILDRSIWEDFIFAKLLMKDEPKSYEHFKKLWRKTIENALNKFGTPKLYIYLKVDWENFKKRIFNRNREAEIANFSQNEEYFKDLLNEYINNFRNIVEEWGIPFLEIDTTKMNHKEVIDFAMTELKNRGIA